MVGIKARNQQLPDLDVERFGYRIEACQPRGGLSIPNSLDRAAANARGLDYRVKARLFVAHQGTDVCPEEGAGVYECHPNTVARKTYRVRLRKPYRFRYIRGMDTNIPSAEEVRATLGKLSMAQVHVLAGLSGVPWTTLRKIRDGETPNPRLETVRQFAPHVTAAMGDKAPEPAAAVGGLTC